MRRCGLAGMPIILISSSQRERICPASPRMSSICSDISKASTKSGTLLADSTASATAVTSKGASSELGVLPVFSLPQEASYRNDKQDMI